MGGKSITVIIPAYNEERRLGNTLKKIIRYLKEGGFEYEIIVVDDGSKDNTVNIAQKFKAVKVLKNKENKGKGYSVKRGVMESKKDLVLFSDSDLSTPIEELEKFIPYIKDHDIIIGSRRMKDSDVRVKQPFYRTWAGKIFPIIVNIILVRNIRDTQCGFKLFKKDVAKKLFPMQRIFGFSFDAEILYLANKFKYKIKEIPVVWINSGNSKLNLIKDSFRMFQELLKIKMNDKKGLYTRKGFYNGEV